MKFGIFSAMRRRMPWRASSWSISSGAEPALPPRQDLQALLALVQLGYYRGIVNKLDALAQAHPACSPFIADLGKLARQYQFEAMSGQLQKVLNEPVH